MIPTNVQLVSIWRYHETSGGVFKAALKSLDISRYTVQVQGCSLLFANRGSLRSFDDSLVPMKSSHPWEIRRSHAEVVEALQGSVSYAEISSLQIKWFWSARTFHERVFNLVTCHWPSGILTGAMYWCYWCILPRNGTVTAAIYWHPPVTSMQIVFP